MNKQIFLAAAALLLLTGCARTSTSIIGGADGPTHILITEQEKQPMYEQITPQQAKEIMDARDDILILDVREQEEYDAGHVPGAALIPYTEIEQRAGELPEDKDTTILVYCRSGRRSKIAAESLARLGYTAVMEFGGINDWPYEIVK